MWKKISLIVLILFAIAIAVMAYLYFFSLDWERRHRAHVESLPLLDGNSDTGEFRVAASGFEFRCRVKGLQQGGDGVILLHGFPEASITWEPLAKAIADAGFRVVACDQRGYSPGARPEGVEHYATEHLAGDVIAIADTVGFSNFHLVGHDWGSAVGWTTVFGYSDRIYSWTGMAIPHAGVFFDALINNEEQAERSRYFAFLRKPWLPEFLFTYNKQTRMKSMLQRLPVELREEYLAIHTEPGAFTAALNWYRALDLDAVVGDQQLAIPVSTPTLFIWGNEDGVIAGSTVKAQAPLMVGPYREMELDAGHSLLLEAPEAVIPAVLQHLQQNRSSGVD